MATWRRSPIAGNLVPDVAIEKPAIIPLRGRNLELRPARRAATETDIWLWDPRGRTAIVGDLVTLPVPFLDTACPTGWQGALAEVAAVAPAQIVPGHGPVLTPAEFGLYRSAFEALLDCSAGTTARETCVDRWVAGLGRADQPGRAARARAMLAYYIHERLRPAAKRSEYCGRGHARGTGALPRHGDGVSEGP